LAAGPLAGIERNLDATIERRRFGNERRGAKIGESGRTTSQILSSGSAIIGPSLLGGKIIAVKEFA
jgi:hypothetical protein